MKDKKIKVADNSMVYFDDKVLGIDGENLQGKIIFYFENFKNGVAWLEFEKEDGTKKYIPMNKVNETYEVEIKPSLLSDTSIIYLQLRITEDENENGIPVFKSKKFYMNILDSINATSTIEEDYPDILDVLNNKQDKLKAGENITIKDNVISANIEGTVNKTYVDEQDTKTLESAKQYADKQVPNVVETYVNEHKEELKGDKGDTGSQGPQGLKGDTGSAGADAKINGVNTLTIEAGDNITLEQEGSTLTINSTGGSGGTSNYNALTNKPKINNVELNGNKTSSDLGLQPAGNYALESEIPTKTSDLTNDSGFITGYTETDPTVPNYVKNITQANITSWNNKSDFSGNYNDLSNKPTIPSEVTESTVSGWGFTKNTGTYSKPSGGIPKTDLASAVQTSLGKADTALQSISSSDVTSALGYTPYNSTNPNGYTSNVGTITGITMNGASKGTSGVVDLGTVITSHQDISGKANKISVVQTSTSTIEINSNTFYKFGEVASLNITLTSITDNTIYNEYMFEFVSGATATTLTLPDTIKWLETPTIDANKIYQCSIVDNIGLLVGVANV